MESLSLEKENVIKDIGNLFRLKKETKAIKNRTPRDIKNLFEHEEENYYWSLRVRNFWSINYIEYGSNGDRTKTQPVQDILKKLYYM